MTESSRFKVKELISCFAAASTPCGPGTKVRKWCQLSVTLTLTMCCETHTVCSAHMAGEIKAQCVAHWVWLKVLVVGGRWEETGSRSEPAIEQFGVRSGWTWRNAVKWRSPCSGSTRPLVIQIDAPTFAPRSCSVTSHCCITEVSFSGSRWEKLFPRELRVIYQPNYRHLCNHKAHRCVCVCVRSHMLNIHVSSWGSSSLSDQTSCYNAGRPRGETQYHRCLDTRQLLAGTQRFAWHKEGPLSFPEGQRSWVFFRLHTATQIRSPQQRLIIWNCLCSI